MMASVMPVYGFSQNKSLVSKRTERLTREHLSDVIRQNRALTHGG